MTKQELLDMKLHETIAINDRLVIFRVFGGWIYNAVFVPEVLNVEARTSIESLSHIGSRQGSSSSTGNVRTQK